MLAFENSQFVSAFGGVAVATDANTLLSMSQNVHIRPCVELYIGRPSIWRMDFQRYFRF